MGRLQLISFDFIAMFVAIVLLSSYKCRCESCHGQAERLLDSAKEMEDSIAVNLRSVLVCLLCSIC